MGKREAAAALQLGMSISTARSRLVKMLLFRELQRSGNTNCYRCSEKIEDIDHLSIEHKNPWLHISPDLFWDLDNIEFSHVRCNVPHRRNNGAHVMRKIGPKGTSWCFRCKKFLPIEKFHKNASVWHGLSRQCIDCNHYWRSNKQGRRKAQPTRRRERYAVKVTEVSS